jgi:uncharacterized protein (TIGR03435 family)
MRRTTVVACVVLLTAIGILAQSGSATLTFEVASIKPSGADPHGAFQIMPGGGLRTVGTSLKMLIGQAYDVRDFQISGGPNWISTDRFDITAKPGTGSESPSQDPRTMTDESFKTVGDQMRERLRSLLADRFRLALHRETKEESVYVLVVAKGGPKLHASEVNGGSVQRPMMRMGRGDLSGQAAPLAFLVQTLSSQLGRPVIDHTGLTGHYDFTLQWTPDPGQPAASPAIGPDAPPPPDPNGPSIFAAVQEQLGLRLESQKGPVEMLVIDRVEKPSEN